MKKIFIVILGLCALAGSPEPGTMVVSGEIANLQGDYILLMRSDKNRSDSIRMDNGKFSAVVKYDGMEYLTLSVPEKITGGVKFHHIINVFPEPGKIYIKGDFADNSSFAISGAPVNNMYNELRSHQAGLEKEFLAGSQNDAAAGQLKEKLLAIYKNCAEKNLDNLLGVYCIYSLYGSLEVDEIIDLTARLGDGLQQTAQIKKINEELLRIDRQKKVAEGKVPDITQATPSGTQVSLLTVCAGNKYVLLDFWASWCGPCVAEFPELKKAYEKFKDKGFEIYGVSLDDKKENWEKALGKYNMTWLNVSDLGGWTNSAAVEYGISAIPDNFLIDSNGFVVARGLRGDNLSRKLETLFE